MNYAELIAEVAEWANEPGFAMRAAQYTKQAETELAQHFKPMEYPAITGIASAGTNWLLRDNQEIYIAAILKQFYLFKLDADRAQAVDSYLTGLIDAKKVSDRVVRYSGEKPAIGGHTP
jgi:hypothetical protein